MKAILHIARFGGLYLLGLILYATVFWGVWLSHGEWTWSYPITMHLLAAIVIWVAYGLTRIGKGGE